MHKIRRHERIIEELGKKDMVTVVELADILKTSLMTIRRDLDELHELKLINKIHGGAVLLKQDSIQPSFKERFGENVEEKIKISKEAIKLIKTNSIVFFDAGTTPYVLASKIPDELQFTAITAGLQTATILCTKPNVSVISIGGDIHKSSFSSINNMATENIRKLRADIAFISTKAIHLPYGTFEPNFSLIDVKRAIVSASEEVVLLADRSKFETKSLSLSVSMSNINCIISDDKINQTIIDEINRLNIKLIIAH